MTKRTKQQQTVLVTDSERGSAITIIRSLGRSGYRVIAADSTAMSAGFWSRYTHASWVYPNPGKDPEGFVSSLSHAVRQYQIDLLIPVTDAAILPLSRERDHFQGLAKLAIPEPAALEMVTNKQKTIALAEQVGVPTPRTAWVHTVAEALEKAHFFTWPIVLKPQVSRFYQKDTALKALEVSYAQNPAQLLQRMQQYEGCPVLLQEYYMGSGEGVELLLHRGQPLAAFQHRRLREVPISGGASSFRESIPLEPVQYEYALRLLRALKWTGLAMVEFKVGQEGPKLMEINGRVWGSLPLAVLSGMDFPSRLAALYLEGPPPADARPELNYNIGVRSSNLALDILWIGSVLYGKQRYSFLERPKRSAGFKALLDLFRPSIRLDVQSLDDPKPGLVELVHIAQSLYKKLRKRNHHHAQTVHTAPIIAP